MNRTLPLFILTAILVAAGCSALLVAHTEVSGVADPLYYDKQYRGVLIRVESGDLILRKHLEERIAEVFAGQGVQAYSDVLLFPPTRDWNEESVRQVYEARGIQAMLVMHELGFGADSVYVPGSATTQKQTESYTDTTRRGKPIEKKNTTVTTTYTDPRVDAHPWMTFGATLFDTASDEKAWIASGRCQGALPNNALAADIGKALFKALLEYKLVYRNE